MKLSGTVITTAAAAVMNKLLNKLFGFEVSTEIQDLPRGKAKQTTHGEDGKVEDPRVSGLCNADTQLHMVIHYHQQVGKN